MNSEMKQSKSKRLAIDTILFGISTFGSKILVFLMTPLYTAVLLTEEYGVADLINTTVNMIYPILTLAIADATLRYALDKGVSPKAVLGNSFALTLLSVFVLIAFYPILTLFQSEITVQLTRYWWYFVGTYAAFNFYNCVANFIKGIEKTKLFAVQGIVQTVTVIASNIYFLLIAKRGLQGYLLSMIIGFVVPTVLVFLLGKLHRYLFPLKLDGKLFAEMMKYSIPMIPTLLAWSINMYINKYMIIGLLPGDTGLSESGIFSVAHKIPSLLTAVLSVFTQAWQISAISNVNDADESEFHTRVYSSMHVIALLGCMAILPLSKWFAGLLFDPSYFSAWQYIPFLTLSAFFSCMCGFLASAFRAYKKTGQLFTSVLIGAIINIVLNVVLIQTIGVVGAAIATAISFFVTWLVRMITVQKIVKVKIAVLPTILTYVLLTVGCALISFNIRGAYIFYGASVLVILILNGKDLLKLLVLMKQIAGKLFRRLKRRGM